MFTFYFVRKKNSSVKYVNQVLQARLDTAGSVSCVLIGNPYKVPSD